MRQNKVIKIYDCYKYKRDTTVAGNGRRSTTVKTTEHCNRIDFEQSFAVMRFMWKTF